jgi:hypothetical protein
MNTTTELVNVPAPSSKTRPSISTLVALLVGAALPVLVALVLLGSALLHRPLFGRFVDRWPAAELLGLSITDPAGIVARALGSLALEGGLYIASDAYLRTRASGSGAGG